MDTDGGNLQRLTPEMKGLTSVRMSTYEEHSPAWTNDGKQILFISNAHGNYEVLSLALDGSGIRRITNTSEQERNVSAAVDAPIIAFERVIASDAADIVVELPDGSQEHQFQTDFPLATERYSSRKPKFMPGGDELVFVKRWAGRAGESLHLMDVKTGTTTKDLVAKQQDHALVFAVSPDGSRIAYHSVAEWGKRNNSIVIIDRAGTLLKTISVPDGIEIRSISWGAPPIRVRATK